VEGRGREGVTKEEGAKGAKMMKGRTESAEAGGVSRRGGWV